MRASSHTAGGRTSGRPWPPLTRRHGAAASDRRVGVPGSPKRELRESAPPHRRTSRIPSARASGFTARTRDAHPPRHTHRPPIVVPSPVAAVSDRRALVPRASLRSAMQPAGKPEAEAEGIRVASPEARPHSLGSRLGLHGTDTRRTSPAPHAPPSNRRAFPCSTALQPSCPRATRIGFGGQRPPLQKAGTTQAPGLEGRVNSSGRRPARQKSHDAMFCLRSETAAPGWQRACLPLPS